jgi:glycosyltransferase involved in cell wall biosynthesis
VQTYIREILAHLVGVVDAGITAAVQADAVSELPPGVLALARRPSNGVRRAVAGARSLGPVDLVHGLDVDLPLRRRSPMVATIHDLAVFDVPWAFPRARAGGERLLIAATARRADALIVMSAFTAERVKARFGRDATVIPLAPGPDLVPPTDTQVRAARERYALPDRFVLHVGNIEPRKDVAGLAAACQRADLPLVLAGARVGDAVDVPAYARPIGYVPADYLASLYGAATVVCYPTRYEGFGLPPVEAMACGAPVVASRIPPLVEVLGDGAELVAAGDVDELARILRRLFDDEDCRQAVAAAGQRRVSSLSWVTAATATASVYRSLGIAV